MVLRAYVEDHSERAFQSLVERHSGFVYASALRQLGNRTLAEDVTQAVFIALATKAHRLNRKVLLVGWLHRATRFAALHASRGEARRRLREGSTTVPDHDEPSESDAGALWIQAAPLLDAALAELPSQDRDAVLLRFFEKRTLRDVGVHMGVAEDAAKKRVARALERLKRILFRRGLGVTVAVLAGVLSQHTVEAAPPRWSRHSVVALHPGAGTSLTVSHLVKGIMKAMFWSKAKWSILVALGLACTLPLAMPRAWGQAGG